jgi:hypothetical protein
MSRLHLKSIAFALAVTVLLVLGATTGGAFAHEVQHEAHHAAGMMHATPICAWMCATDGAVITPTIQPVQFTLVHVAEPPLLSHLRSSKYLSRLQARAPPVLS